MAKRMGCKVIQTKPMTVSVAGGKKLMSMGVCKDFQWKMNGEVFTTDVMLLPLGSCEMVLGVQWLSTLGDIRKWNFKELRMEFMHNNRRVILRGTAKAPVHWVDGRK